MKNTIEMMTVVFMPTTLDTSSSSPIARTALPKDVLLSRTIRSAKPTKAMPMVKTLNPLMFAPPMVQGSLPKASGRGRGAL